MTTSYSRLLTCQHLIVRNPLSLPPPLPLPKDDFQKSGTIHLLANTTLFATTTASQSGNADTVWKNISSLAEQLLLRVIWKNTALVYPPPKKLELPQFKTISPMLFVKLSRAIRNAAVSLLLQLTIWTLLLLNNYTYDGLQLVASLSAWQRYQNLEHYSATLIQRSITGYQTLFQQYELGPCGLSRLRNIELNAKFNQLFQESTLPLISGPLPTLLRFLAWLHTIRRSLAN